MIRYKPLSVNELNTPIKKLILFDKLENETWTHSAYWKLNFSKDTERKLNFNKDIEKLNGKGWKKDLSCSNWLKAS